MKRSEINKIMADSILFMKEMNFKLPPWAYWKPQDWKGKYETCYEIVDNMLGWDITDFGKDDFNSTGLFLFTLRNGNADKDKKQYAEKIMIVNENQETPMHFHWQKMEDIINRGGGNLIIEMYDSDKNEQLSDNDFKVKVDGIENNIYPGDKIKLTPGESICLEPGIYHRFYGEPGKGKVLVGEVSAVNDDNTDNCFLEPLGRFPEIEEDEPPIHIMSSEYNNYL